MPLNDPIGRSLICPRAFRDACGAFATGVAVVTTCGADGQNVGMTINSFSSVSLDPPLILWCIKRTAWSLPSFVQSRKFGVSVLTSSQQDIAERFSHGRPDKFAGIDAAVPGFDLPLIPGALVHMMCGLQDVHAVGDHLVLVGYVERITATAGEGLTFFRGRYSRTGRSTASEGEE